MLQVELKTEWGIVHFDSDGEYVYADAYECEWNHLGMDVGSLLSFGYLTRDDVKRAGISEDVLDRTLEMEA